MCQMTLVPFCCVSPPGWRSPCIHLSWWLSTPAATAGQPLSAADSAFPLPSLQVKAYGESEAATPSSTPQHEAYEQRERVGVRHPAARKALRAAQNLLEYRRVCATLERAGDSAFAGPRSPAPRGRGSASGRGRGDSQELHMPECESTASYACLLVMSTLFCSHPSVRRDVHPVRQSRARAMARCVLSLQHRPEKLEGTEREKGRRLPPVGMGTRCRRPNNIRRRF